MENGDYISVKELCRHYAIEYSFVSQLSEHGLIELIEVGEQSAIRMERLGEFERHLRMHYELDINFEGLEVIAHLLEKLDSMQSELHHLRARLKNEGLE
ncbi:MAG TPA: chaperone modulator CbpM [Bacteroidia bacterium]|nr:chaperone modulator CbpM [Bacteroidia bacterium]